MNINGLIEDLLKLEFVNDKNLNYHPEKNVLSHSLQTYYIAKKESSGNIFLMFCALFHDIGKLTTHKEEGLQGHEVFSVEILKKHGIPSHYNSFFYLIENHMRIKYYLSGEMKKLKKVKSLTENNYFRYLIQLNRFDIMGRKAQFKVKESDIIEITSFLNNFKDTFGC